jgi:hypothetical protein
VFSLHFSPNIVREIYPALSIADHLSFRVDEYANLHPDLFETEGRGWHIGNNPGASMVAAIPYAFTRPIIDRIVKRVELNRQRSSRRSPPAYKSPWPLARKFHAEAWSRGLDLKLGLAAFVMQSLCMAVSSALGVILLFGILRHVLGSDRAGLGFALLYAFGTPVFFRTGFLNHNMMLGHAALFGFFVLWNPGGTLHWTLRRRSVVAGLAGGAAVLFDYSGLVFLLTLFAYALGKTVRAGSERQTARVAGWYILGSLLPLGLLWFYQWKSFGNPFLPGQHWMPPVEWSDLGYQGYGRPQLKLLIALAFDHRFGLFTTSPILLLSLVYLLLRIRETKSLLPQAERRLILAAFVGLWIFFSGNNYTFLQYNTGVRYMAPIIPFLFIPTACFLSRFRRTVVYVVVVFSVASSWALAMYRDVEGGLGVLRPIAQTFLGGFQLPALRSLSYVEGGHTALLPLGTSPLPLFVLTAGLLYILWMPESLVARTDAPHGEIR